MDALIGAMRRKTFDLRQVVAAEGEMDDAFFIIESGEAIVKKGEVCAAHASGRLHLSRKRNLISPLIAPHRGSELGGHPNPDLIPRLQPAPGI